MASFTKTLTFKKSTKGTHVYEDTDDDAPVTQVYVKRSALSSDDVAPPSIVLTIMAGS